MPTERGNTNLKWESSCREFFLKFRRVVFLFSLLALPAFSRAPQAQAESVLKSLFKKTPSHSDILADLKRRGVVTPDAEDFTADDADLLARMKRAEALGAVDFLARKVPNLRPFVFEVKKNGRVRLRLNQLGFNRYLFFLSQKAIGYFESRDIDAKWAFGIKDLSGRNVFDSKGLLTQAGNDLYDRILKKEPVEWQLASGRVMANHRIIKKLPNP